MTVVIVLCSVLLSLAFVAVTARVVKGPALLDRVVAMDMMLAIIGCTLGTIAAVRHDSTLVPVIIVVALLGFIGSVTIALLLDPERED